MVVPAVRRASLCARLVVVLHLLLLPGLALAGESPAPAPYEVLLQEAREALGARDAHRAIELLRPVLDRTPARAEAWYWLSKACEWADRIDEAIAAGERAQELGFLAGPRLDYRLAQLHARAGHADEAIRWLQRSLEHGFENRPAIAADGSFAALKEDPRFTRLAGLPPAGQLTRVAGWRFDLDYLMEEAQRLHVHPGRATPPESFREEAAKLREAIPRMSDDEILAAMMRLVAALGDGHSVIYGPDEDSPLEFNRRTLPLKLYLFPEGLYIVDGIEEWARYAGYRVVRLGDLAAEEALSRISAYRGVDNAMTWRWMGPQFYLPSLLLLHEVGAATEPGVVELALESPDGEVSKVRVEGGDFPILRKLRPSPASPPEPPRYLSRVETNYWMEPLPSHQALYVQFNQVRDAEDESLSAFADRMLATLAESRARTLIVDVRHNNGGNNGLLRPLIRALVGFEMAGPDHRIFVITGRNTFSAAQNFISRVERWTDATFAGEPSSSSPNFVGEETELLLPWSRVRGSISSRYWQDSDPGDERAWIDPDIPVLLSAKEYFAGRDPVLEAVLSRLQRAESTPAGPGGAPAGSRP